MVARTQYRRYAHHENIERWRRDQRLLLTAQHRPDLLDAARRAGALDSRDVRVLSGKS